LSEEFDQNTLDGAEKQKKLWPSLDSGLHIVSQREGSKISVSGKELHFTDAKGKIINHYPIINIGSLTIIGFVQITTQAIHVLSKKSIPITFLSATGTFVGQINSQLSINTVVRRSQVIHFEDQKKCLVLAKALIHAKIMNQRTMLMRNCSNLPKFIAESLLETAKKALMSPTLESLRGYEGYASSLYFRNFAGAFKGSVALQFANNGRKRRPPPDPVNACLSFAYTMLTKDCVSALHSSSLEPGIGAFHVSVPGRPALALDLMEPFRPLISDSVAITCFNKNELTEDHFTTVNNSCSFTREGLQIFFHVLNGRMKTEISHQTLDYKLSYLRMIFFHAKMIAAWLVGDIEELSFLITR
jgi:CRISPR-associated protein Cas1